MEFNFLQVPHVTVQGILSALMFLAAVIAIAVFAGRILEGFIGLNRKVLTVIVGVAVYVVRFVIGFILARFTVDIYVMGAQIYHYVVLGVGGLIILIALARGVMRILFGGR